MVITKLDRRRIIRSLILLLLLNSCSNQTKKQSTGAFQCDEYWTMKNTEWETAYDDVKFCSNEMILKSKDSIWGIIFPGTLTLDNDTIHVNQESGYNNICRRIGQVKVGDSVFVERFKKKELFLILNDSLIEFAGNQFEKSKIPVMYGCWCEWK